MHPGNIDHRGQKPTDVILPPEIRLVRLAAELPSGLRPPSRSHCPRGGRCAHGVQLSRTPTGRSLPPPDAGPSGSVCTGRCRPTARRSSEPGRADRARPVPRPAHLGGTGWSPSGGIRLVSAHRGGTPRRRCVPPRGSAPGVRNRCHRAEVSTRYVITRRPRAAHASRLHAPLRPARTRRAHLARPASPRPQAS